MKNRILKKQTRRLIDVVMSDWESIKTLPRIPSRYKSYLITKGILFAGKGKHNIALTDTEKLINFHNSL